MGCKVDFSTAMKVGAAGSIPRPVYRRVLSARIGISTARGPWSLATLEFKLCGDPEAGRWGRVSSVSRYDSKAVDTASDE